MVQSRSAGVYHTEIDESLFVQAAGVTSNGVVGGAHKGPKDVATRVTSQSDFLNKFGTPDTVMGRAIFHYLRTGREAWVVRVAKNDAFSQIDILDSGSVKTFTIFGKTSGDAYDGIKIHIYTSIVGGAGKFKMVVEVNGFPAETYEELDKDTMEATINDPLVGSEYVTVTNDSGNTNEPVVGQIKTLANGDSGISSLTSSEYIGLKTGNTTTGLQAFSNKDTVPIDNLSIPGQSASSVIIAIQDMLNLRKDVYGQIDPPFGLSVDEIIDFHNGTGAWGGSHPALNTHRACLDWPWVKIYDPYTKKEEWMAPSGVVTNIMAYNDTIAYPWFSAAGYDRGKIHGVLDIEYSPDETERHLLNGTYNINPFVNFGTDGIVRWGSRTLQRTATALRSEHIRRMLFYAEKQLDTVYKRMTHEPNDARSWKELKNLADGVLAPIQSLRGLYDYKIIVDDTINTPTTIDNERAIVKLLLKPTRKIKEIIVNWTLLRTGSQFDEFI